jgi:hemophore-related protein
MKKMSARTVRRCLYGMCAGGVLSAGFTIPMANAGPEQCSESGVAGTVSSVAASTGTYLTEHPQADQALTDIARQPDDRADDLYRSFFAGNPQVAQDLKKINQPVVDLTVQCGIDVTPTPVSDALEEL